MSTVYLSEEKKKNVSHVLREGLRALTLLVVTHKLYSISNLKFQFSQFLDISFLSTLSYTTKFSNDRLIVEIE